MTNDQLDALLDNGIRIASLVRIGPRVDREVVASTIDALAQAVRELRSDESAKQVLHRYNDAIIDLREQLARAKAKADEYDRIVALVPSLDDADCKPGFGERYAQLEADLARERRQVADLEERVRQLGGVACPNCLEKHQPSGPCRDGAPE